MIEKGRERLGEEEKERKKVRKSDKERVRNGEGMREIEREEGCREEDRGVYSTRVSFALPPPRMKSLGMLPLYLH